MDLNEVGVKNRLCRNLKIKLKLSFVVSLLSCPTYSATSSSEETDFLAMYFKQS